MNRADRRRQLKEEERRIARGIDVRRIDRPDIVALLRTLDHRVQLSIQRKSVTPLMEFLYANVRSAARSIDDVTIACRQGCSHCCQS